MNNRLATERKQFVAYLLAALALFVAGWIDAAPAAFQPHTSMLPQLTARDVDGEEPITLEQLAVTVTTRGHIARVAFELTYHNAADRDLNGEFVVPLPEGAEITDLGLDFDGVLRHAVSVPREEARTAFEQVVHRRVDPILAEWTEGNSFRYEVYPIPAGGSKKIFVAWDQDLLSDGAGPDFSLTLDHPGELTRALLRVDADPGALAVVEKGRESLQLGSSGKVEVEKGPLHHTIRVLASDMSSALAERDGDSTFVSMLVSNQVPREPVRPSSHVVVFWDASGSGNAMDRDAVITFLESFMKRQAPGARLTVVPFHVSLDDPVNVRVPTLPGQTIRRTIEAIPSVGATDLSALADGIGEMIEPLPADGRVLIVTDGLQSLGRRLTADQLGRKLSSLRWPIAVITSASRVNRPLLDAISGATGGWRLDVESDTVERAVDEAMLVPPSVEVLGSPDLVDLTPSGRIVVSNGMFVVRGRAQGPVDECRIRLRVHDRDGSTDKVVKATVRQLDGSDGIVRTAWARSSVRDLIAKVGVRNELIALGTRHRLLTPETSLIVLEDWRDYVRYDIPMPDDLAEERARWEEAQKRPRPVATSPHVAGLMPPPPIAPGSWILRGFVMHEGVPLPGATVKLTGNGVGQFAVSDVNGLFTFNTPSQPTSLLTITAELEGLSTETRTLEAGTPSGAVVELNLQISTIAEAITVTAAAPTHLQTGGATSPASAKSGVRFARAPSCPECDSILDDIVAGARRPADRDALFWRHRAEIVRQVSLLIERASSNREAVEIYLRARSRFGGSKLFHLRAAEALRARDRDLGARALADLVETFADDPAFLRLVSQIFLSWGREDIARATLERAVELAPQQPQGWRDLIILEARAGNDERVDDLAGQLARREPDRRFREVYEILEIELQRYREASKWTRRRGLDIEGGNENGLTGVLRWDSNYCYVDLHVCEPSTDMVNYSETQGSSGGIHYGGGIEGFGPQLYVNSGPERGTYQFYCDYYSQDLTELSTESIAVLTIYSKNRLGRMERTDHTIVVSEDDERIEVAEVVVR